MGCITSKVMSKSISFKEELNQRRSNSISSIEELIISGNKSDQFLALLCSANIVGNKLQSTTETSESNTNAKPDILDVSNNESIRGLELATNGEEKQSHAASRLVQSSSASPTMDVDHHDLARRSKSCHWFPMNEVSSMASFDVIKEDGPNGSKKPRGRARSIHTVEEYDAILEKLWLSRSQQTGFDAQLAPSLNANDKKSSHEVSGEEKESTETSVSSLALETTEANPNPSSSTKEVLAADKGEAQEQNISERGFKRKSVAKGLESLSLPQTIEFQSVGSLEDWIQVGGQVYSPGAYATPKFGSYALPSSTTENKCNESVAFNPELVAVFEECMQQLQAEEEIVLKQIGEDLEEESSSAKQSEGEEDIPSHSKDIQVHI